MSLMRTRERILTPVPEQQSVINYLSSEIAKDKNISIAELTRLLNFKITSNQLIYKGKPKVAHAQVSSIVKNNNLREI